MSSSVPKWANEMDALGVAKFSQEALQQTFSLDAIWGRILFEYENEVRLLEEECDKDTGAIGVIDGEMAVDGQTKNLLSRLRSCVHHRKERQTNITDLEESLVTLQSVFDGLRTVLQARPLTIQDLIESLDVVGMENLTQEQYVIIEATINEAQCLAMKAHDVPSEVLDGVRNNLRDEEFIPTEEKEVLVPETLKYPRAQNLAFKRLVMMQAFCRGVLMDTIKEQIGGEDDEE